MSTFYIDYENGDDGNAGTSWALAWKTVLNGATAARTNAGDVIRFAKSPDPTSLGQTATWTNLSDVITLSSAVTLSVVDGGETWTRSTDVTGSETSAIRKVGSYSGQFIIATAFTTGKIAYHTLAGGSTDYSGYQQISFQIYTSVAISASTLSIRLCSDTVGDTTVDTITVPALAETGKFYTITIDTAGALGSAIQSIALYADADPGTPTINLGQVIACKASSSADSLSLTSLISKESSATSVEWWAIRGIIGTSVYLDHGNTTSNPTTGVYYGTTESVTTYKRETIKVTPMTSGTTGAEFSTNEGNLTFSGGWDTATTTQNGMTFYDGQNGEGPLIDINGADDNLVIENFGLVRSWTGIYNYVGGNGLTFRNISIVNTTYYGTQQDRVSTQTWDNIFMAQIGQRGLNLSYAIGAEITNSKLYHAQSLYIDNSIATIRNTELLTESSQAVYLANGSVARAHNCLFSGTGTQVNVLGYGSLFTSSKHDQTVDNHAQYHQRGQVYSDTTTRHTASGIAWEMYNFSSTSSESLPVKFKIATILVTNASTTVTVWVNKTHATFSQCKLIVPGGQIAGVDNDVEDAAASSTGYQQLSVNFTPTETGVIDVYVYGWYVSTNASIYVDDFAVTT